jgi:putative holliday junction resolvase
VHCSTFDQKYTSLKSKGRLIGLDVGEKRTGIAVTDAFQLIASPLEGVETSQLTKRLRELILEEECVGIIVGLPLRLHGEMSEIEGLIQKFVRSWEQLFRDIPISRVDERFTSKMASASLFDSGVSKKNRRDKFLIDATSAAIILQSYLNQRR